MIVSVEISIEDYKARTGETSRFELFMDELRKELNYRFRRGGIVAVIELREGTGGITCQDINTRQAILSGIECTYDLVDIQLWIDGGGKARARLDAEIQEAKDD